MFVVIALIAFAARLAAAAPDARQASVREQGLTVARSWINASAHPAAEADDGGGGGPARTGALDADEGFDPAVSDAASAAAEADASFDPAWTDASAASGHEADRRDRTGGLGRLDLTITWRRTVRVADMRGTFAPGTYPDPESSPHTVASPLDPVTTARGVLWVLLTWSR